jgi:hypothetical protein
MSVSVEGVCRRKLEEKFNTLLDRLTHEVHPEGADPELEDFESAERKEEKPEETLAQKRKRLIEEGKMHADVRKALREYEEKLTGNSKMLQDPTGKIAEHKEEVAKEPGKTNQGTKPKTK